MGIDFKETKTFSRKRKKLLPEEYYQDLQEDLSEFPGLGDRIPGGDGIRKIRARIPGKGKSGGVRIIYFWAVSRDTILMLDIYGKNQKSDLTPAELKNLVSVKNEYLG